MTTWQARQTEVLLLTARQAWEQPLLESGLWTHGDIRNNYYLASYLIVAVADTELGLPFDREGALAKASDVLTVVLMLQDGDPSSPTYGHWPLGLGEMPDKAQKNTLPAELMGCFIVYFHQRFASILPEPLCRLIEQTMENLYRSKYYRAELKSFGHHEAKYTASKLLFGHRCEDQELMEIGLLDLDRTLVRVRELGMPEYGSLPWFWHWIQAYTCAYECLPDGEVRSKVSELLDELWSYRAVYYLQGAWVGGRMRSLSHDLPRDGNVAFDYIQFGDFVLPTQLPRVEYAGLLFHQAPDKAMQTALHRIEPQETKRIIVPASDAPNLHSYLYMEKSFAVGGIWERVKEFDNEQLRWDISFPLNNNGSINRLYVFPPGEGYNEGDPRHADEGGEVLFHRSTVMAIYPECVESNNQLVGVLPLGEWVQEQGALYGRVDEVYIALYTPGTIHITEQTDRFSIVCEGSPNGIVVDMIRVDNAEKRSIRHLEDFVNFMDPRKPVWDTSNIPNSLNAPNTMITRNVQSVPNALNTGVSYETLNGDRLCMGILEGGLPIRTINDLIVDFDTYSTPGHHAKR